jgi:hypothetical protein
VRIRGPTSAFSIEISSIINRPRLRKMPLPSILPRVNRLTRQEILFIVTVAGLLLTGLLVKFYRQSHPPAAAVTPDHHARN